MSAKVDLRRGVARLVRNVREWFERRSCDHAKLLGPVAVHALAALRSVNAG
jgi:hypothetical protein